MVVINNGSSVHQLIRDDGYDYAEESVKQFLYRQSVVPDQLCWVHSGLHSDLPRCFKSSSGVADFEPLHQKPDLNRYLQCVHEKLEDEEYLSVRLETKNIRRTRILNARFRVLGWMHYLYDVAMHRVAAKLMPTRRIYDKITGGQKRSVTLTEALGRLYFNGFSVIAHQRIGYHTHILARKTYQPVEDRKPTYGALVNLNRVGYRGEMIKLFKLRTMHPYSEYLQEYVYDQHGTSNGDKIDDDFRVTSWGKYFRKFWIDELPMIWNWMKRDLKLVGVRPLSRHKYETYPEELQKKRVSVKPGLVPPFYADLPETPEDFFRVEDDYLNAYLQKPIRTDIRYFFKAMYNIFIKRARSA